MNVQDNPHLLVAMGARNLGSTALSIFVQENLSMINCCDISTYNIQDSYFGNVGDLLSSLGKAEWLEDIRKGSCPLRSFLGIYSREKGENDNYK